MTPAARDLLRDLCALEYQLEVTRHALESKWFDMNQLDSAREEDVVVDALARVRAAMRKWGP